MDSISLNSQTITIVLHKVLRYINIANNANNWFGFFAQVFWSFIGVCVSVSPDTILCLELYTLQQFVKVIHSLSLLLWWVWFLG